jgi:hypothetical protein
MRTYLLLLVAVAAVFAGCAMWFLLQPEPPCAPGNPACVGGSSLPIYAAFSMTLLLNTACPVILKRARRPVAQIVWWSVALLISSAVVIAAISLFTLRAFMQGHPT